LKNISDRYITYNSKFQLNQILFTITRRIILDSTKLLTITRKTTLNISTLVNTLRSIFTGKLLLNVVKEGDARVKLKSIKEVRETLVFSPSFFRNITESIIPKHIKISAKYPIFLAAAVEYICAEILDLSSIQALKHNHVRITPRDLYLAIHYDIELLQLYNTLNMIIIGSGVTPHADELDEDSKTLQTTTQLLFPKNSFQNMVRNICHSLESDDVKISAKTFTILQHYIESYLITLLQWTGKMCEKTKKSKIAIDDLEFIYNIIK
jgi:histone H3/H4